MNRSDTPSAVAMNSPLLLIQAPRLQALRAVFFPMPTLIRVIEGRKQLWLPDGVQEAHAGQCLLLPAGTQLDIRNLPSGVDGYYRALVVSFEPSVLERFSSLYPDQARRWQGASDRLLLPPLITMDSALHKLAELAHAAADSPWIAHYLHEVLLHLSQAGLGAALVSGQRHSSSAQIRALVSLAPAHRWTARELASRLACSEATLRRRLQAEGCSMRGLLDEIRLGGALGLLQTGNLPISTIAAAVGYESPSRFAARFRQRFGVTPSALR